ncbi:AMP-binding protein, partial [bacterium]|nr:AMP-binding protein [bacterium]
MNVQKAVEQAQQAIGVPSQQPALAADSLLGLWQQALADSSERPAFTCLGQTLSYAEVDQLADRVAGYFSTQFNLEAGDRIAVQLPNLLQYP